MQPYKFLFKVSNLEVPRSFMDLALLEVARFADLGLRLCGLRFQDCPFHRAVMPGRMGAPSLASVHIAALSPAGSDIDGTSPSRCSFCRDRYAKAWSILHESRQLETSRIVPHPKLPIMINHISKILYLKRGGGWCIY